MNSDEFKAVDLTQIRPRPLGSNSTYNHTLIVLDDVNLDEKSKKGKHSTLGYILSQGREFGISLMYVNQGIVTDESDGVTTNEKGQFDTIIITGSLGRFSHNISLLLSKYTSTKQEAQEIERLPEIL